MCGIAGELHFRGPADLAGVQAMTDALAHRGPDADDVWAEGPVALGHRRLAIIDLSDAGRNPLWLADRSAVIVFNGEVYNYRTVRAALEAEGVSFGTGTDTEVVLAAVQRWGIDRALSALIGMFAFAIWDRPAQRLILARDRVGVKPLFYATQGGRLLFGSELRALYAHPAYTRQLDPRGVGQFLVLGYTAGATTVLDQTRRLEAGHYLIADATGAIQTTKYWDIADVRRGSFQGTFDDAADQFESLATDAFRHRLVADVPVGVFLSGGLDSAFLAAVLRKRLDQDLLHITIGFRERRYDEADLAAVTAKALGVRHQIEYLDAPDAVGALQRFNETYDEPFGDSSGIPTTLVSAVARRHVKVALSADGGDEQFCGYGSYLGYSSRYLSMAGWPAPARRLAAACAGSLPLDLLMQPWARARAAAGSPRAISSLEKGLELLRASSAADVVRIMSEKGWPARQVARVVAGCDGDLFSGTVFGGAYGPGRSRDALIDTMMRVDFQAFMRDDVLTKVDRASMSVSLECRDPFVDHRLAEFAFSLPIEFHLQGSVQKRLIRHLLARWVPPEVISAPKRGFVIPLYEWMRGPWRPLVEHHLSAEEVRRVGVLDPRVVTSEVRRFYRRAGIGAERVQLLLNFQMWAARWLNG